MAFGDPLSLTGFKLTFDDEFNSFSSNGPSNPGDSGHVGTWDTTLSYGERKLNDEVQRYYDPAEGINPFSVGDGVLDIHAASSPDPSLTFGASYTSGVITTYHSFSQLYGYFEMRAQLPEAGGMWPAFWLLPKAHVWPPELDLLEAFGAPGPGGDGGAYSFHNGLVSAADGGRGNWNDTGGANLYAQYNTFGVDWEPDGITYYFNGKAYDQRATPAGFNQPMYLLANLAVGGNWAGASIGESGDLRIDYIRAYSKDGANAPVAQQAISSPDGRGYSFYGATDAAGQGPLNGVDLPPLPPTSPPAPAPAPVGDQWVGHGVDDLALLISEDAFQGDAQFLVTVDGVRIGGLLSTSAAHSQGAVQAFHIMGNYAPGRHVVGINFRNNFGGAPGADRNLYLGGALLNGLIIPNASLIEYVGGERSFSFLKGDFAALQAPVPKVVLGAGPDLLALFVSEDAWQGDARFTVAVDGVQVGGVQAASVLRASGLHQEYDLLGSFGPGPHQVAVDFINDAWGGSSALDRNLYVDGASYRGSDPLAATLDLSKGGMRTLTVGGEAAVAPPPPAPTPAPAPTLTPSANLAVAAFLAANLPAASYTAAGLAIASAGLGAAAGTSGTVAAITSAMGSFGPAQTGSTSVAVVTSPAAGSTLVLPSGYAGLIAQGGGAVTLSDAGAAGAVLVGNGAGDTFSSSGRGVTLVGGQGANTFNVSGSAAVATGDGACTVRGSGNAALAVTTGTGGSTVVLAGGTSTVQSNGQDTVFGGAGAATVTTAKGLVAVGGTGRMAFLGGTATSLMFGAQGGVDYTAGSAYDIAVGGSGTLVAQGGAGGGQFWGNSGNDILRATGGTATVLVANNGGQLYSEGAAGNFLIAGAGNATLDGSKAAGNDVFFGGTGKDTIIAGSGNDLIGTGMGTSTVQLGSGKDTVFAFGTSTVTAGSGSADIVMGGTVTLNIAAGDARNFALFNFVPGTDKISLSGYDGSTVANVIAAQTNGGGQTVLTLGDQTRIQLVGVTRVDASFFG